MEVVISGSAGMLAVPYGSSFQIFRTDDDVPRCVGKTEAQQIFSQVYDAERLQVGSVELALAVLAKRSAFDQALLLMQALSRAKDAGRQLRILVEVEKVFDIPGLFEEITNLVYSLPTSQVVELACPPEAAPRAYSFVSELMHRQEAIKTVRLSFDQFAPLAIDNEETLAMWEDAAIKRGVFRKFVMALHMRENFTNTLLDAYKTMSDQPSYRDVIGNWSKAWSSLKKLPKIQKAVLKESIIYSDESFVAVHEQRESVRKQIEAIEYQVARGDVTKAALFAEQLVGWQLRNSPDGRFASMSLCNIAQAAKANSLFELQERWLDQAVKVAPTDGWAMAQLGDTLLMKNKFAEAEPLFLSAAAYGEEQFALCALGRLYKASGHVESALDHFRLAKNRYPAHSNAAWAWHGEAETLRDIWRFEEALCVYKDAMEKFPDQVITQCGRANVLKDFGQLVEAEEAYRGLMSYHSDDSYVLNGLADVLRLEGAYIEASELYGRSLDIEPSSIIALCGQADIQRGLGNYKEAQILFDIIVKKYPFNPRGFEGLAQSYKEDGNVGAALEVYEHASRIFEFDARTRDGHAQMLAAGSRFKEALALFEKISKIFL